SHHAYRDAAVAGRGCSRSPRDGGDDQYMTLCGMAIAIGAVVGGWDIDVGDGGRAPGEDYAEPSDRARPAAGGGRGATVGIRSSIVFATVIIVLVFLPIFALTGVEGRLLTPLAFAYIVALLASLAVAVIVTPALSAAFLPNAPSIERGHDGWLTRTLKAWFAHACPSALTRPVLLMARLGSLTVMAGVALTSAGTAFLPEFHEGSLTVQANT